MTQQTSSQTQELQASPAGRQDCCQDLPPVPMRQSFRDFAPYDPGFTPVDVLLSANENTYGVPAPVQQLMVQAVANQAFNRYPDPMSNALRDAIASWQGHGLTRGNVCVSNGGDELLFNLLLAFGGPDGMPLINCIPTFSVYKLYAQLTGTPCVDVPRTADFDVDTQAVEAAMGNGGIVVLTSPNNPTGNLVDPVWVQRLAQANPTSLILVDEAYIEFASPQASCTPLVTSCRNVACLRTFSKAFCLAGVRCGYLLADPAVIDGLSAVRQPYSVDVAAQAIAQVAVEHAEAFQPAIRAIMASRDEAIARIGAIPGCVAYPSDANFILVRVPHAHQVWCQLRDCCSILVRDFSGTPGLEDCLRITVGTPEENDRVIAALAQIVKE